MFKELNSKRTIKEGIDLEKMEFVKLKKLAGQTVKVDGFFFTDGRYGRQLVVVGNGYKINMPARAVSQFEDIKADDEMVEAILNGHMVITEIEEAETRNGKTILYTLDDC